MANRSQRMTVAQFAVALFFFSAVCAIGSAVGVVLAMIAPKIAAKMIDRLPYGRVTDSFEDFVHAVNSIFGRDLLKRYGR